MTTSVLVAGGTGRLGTLVVRGLAERGVAVRVMTRDRVRAEHLADCGADVVVGDVRVAEDVRSAVTGVDVVVSAVHGFEGSGRGSVAAVDRNGNAHLVDAAKQSGAEIVLVSVVGAAADSPFELFRMKHDAECYLAASGVPATVVRSTAFLELWLDLMRSTAGRSGRPVVFGRGQNPINFVSVTDVAAAVRSAALDRGSRGRTLEIGGPEDLTLDELARRAATSLGSDLEPRHLSPLALRVIGRTVGLVRPVLGRQTRAALAMDRLDMTFAGRSGSAGVGRMQGQGGA
jgi:uncharacterized protein YbjT (DUF2867 family)